ncbi:hypothetical protein [uncultured Maritalea sp.]|uniref:hypothetical protein n=1 Tax=uncultured Maritalea sp. TaxID=757249 RepID=UPI00261F5C37|nr:hypothetical protein [uncultured Maritalea sp.]
MTSFFKTTNMWLMAAALISFATTALHVFIGTGQIMDPLYASDAPALTKGLAEVMWNQITLLLLVGGGVLWWAATHSQTAVQFSLTIIVLYLGIAILFVVSGLNRFGGLWVMEQWTLFLLMAVLAIVGVAQPKKLTPV